MPETRDVEHGNAQVFARPSSGNLEWRRVRSLLDEVATVTEEPSITPSAGTTPVQGR